MNLLSFQCSLVVYTRLIRATRFEEIMKEIMDIIFKRWEVFKQLEMASKSENIETVRENKVTLDNLAETFQLFNNAFDYFYDIKKAEH